MKYIRIFLLMFLMTLLFRTDDVYAYTLPDFKDIVIGSDGIEKYYIINAVNYHSADNTIKSYNLIVSHVNTKPVIISSYGYDTYRQDAEFTNRTFSVYECKYGDTSWTHVSSSSGYCTIGIPGNMYEESMQYDITILYSNYDLTYNGTTVFYRPRTLARAFQVIPMTVRTGILSQVGFLIPCLISCIIGLIAFRKAWTWLKVQFQG